MELTAKPRKREPAGATSALTRFQTRPPEPPAAEPTAQRSYIQLIPR
jgi:hypothetical protein